MKAIYRGGEEFEGSQWSTEAHEKVISMQLKLLHQFCVFENATNRERMGERVPFLSLASFTLENGIKPSLIRL